MCNIFKHYGFCKHVKKWAKEIKTKEKFIEQVRIELVYYFWSKCEHELVIETDEDNRIFLSPWVGCREPEKVRIDVTDDTSFDWRGFAEKHIGRQIYDNKARVDVYNQVEYIWDDFAEYIWENKEKLLRLDF